MAERAVLFITTPFAFHGKNEARVKSILDQVKAALPAIVTILLLEALPKNPFQLLVVIEAEEDTAIRVARDTIQRVPGVTSVDFTFTHSLHHVSTE